MISYRQSDIFQRFKDNKIKNFTGEFQIICNDREAGDAGDTWYMLAPSFDLDEVPKEVQKEIFAVLTAAGFIDRTFGFSFKVEPGTYIDATYNKILDLFRKTNIKVIQADLKLRNIYIGFKVI